MRDDTYLFQPEDEPIYDDYDRELIMRRARIKKARNRRRRRSLLLAAVMVFTLAACGFVAARLVTIDDIFLSENIGDKKVLSLSPLFDSFGKPDKSDWKLTLVNWENEIPSDFKPRLKEVEDGHLFDERAADALESMLADAREEGLSPIITSAFRSYEVQQELYINKTQYYLDLGYSQEEAEKEAATVVARPGTSEHQLGLAADLTSATYTGLTEAQAETAEFKWLEENSWRYGFILRYPPEKMDLTGIIYEPWHFRYVGKEDAEIMYNSGKCLEEYLAK